MAAIVSSALDFTIVPRQARASERQNAVIEPTTHVYDDVFGPETDVEVIGGDDNQVLGIAPKASETSNSGTGSNNATVQADAGKGTVPRFANALDCAGGICIIYRIGGPVDGDSSDQFHVIASVPTSSRNNTSDLMGRNDNLAESRTIAAFSAGADDFNLNSYGGSGSGDPLGAPDDFAYWQMH